MDDLYQEQILDHYKHPRNVGTIAGREGERVTHHHAANAGCGDSFDVDLLVREGKVADYKWRGVGCAISTAAMSLVSEWVIGKTVEEVHGLTFQKTCQLMGLPDVAAAREKCVTISLYALRQL